MMIVYMMKIGNVNSMRKRIVSMTGVYAGWCSNRLLRAKRPWKTSINSLAKYEIYVVLHYTFVLQEVLSARTVFKQNDQIY